MKDMTYKYKYHILMFLILLLSFINLSSNRENHYQEVDSVLSYDLLQNPENQILTYALSSYSSSKWSNYKKEKTNRDVSYYLNLTPDFLLDFLVSTNFFVNNFEKISKNNFSYPTSADETRAIIVNYFEQENIQSIPIHGLYRIGQGILIGKLPEDVASVFEYPLASTYSFGMALYYKAIDISSENYDGFIKNATLVNLLILHLASMFTFLALINIGIKPFTATISSIALIFTASFYTYAFHLGSTLHTFFAFSVYFFICTQFSLDKESEISKLGKVNALLLFYSYLLIIPLIATYLLTFLNSYVNLKRGFVKSIYSSLVTHRTSLILTALCVILFYQPGQGVRGLAENYSEIPDYIYLSVLNLTGWISSDLSYVNFSQFIITISLLLMGGILFFKENLEGNKKLAIMIIKCSFIIYLIFLFVGLLNFSPSRHILFLQIFVIIFYSYALMRILEPHAKRPYQKAIFILFLVFAGIIFQDYRLKQTRDIDFDYSVLDSNNIIVTDVPNTISKKTNLQVRGLWEKFDESQDFYFISQTTSLNEISKSYSEKILSNNTNVIVLLEVDDKHSFLPFSSTKFDDGRFIYNRGNGMFVYEIKRGILSK